MRQIARLTFKRQAALLCAHTMRTSSTTTGTSNTRVSPDVASAINPSSSTGESVPDPLMYNVPTLSTRSVGRDMDVMSLWQHLLNGRRLQIISGVDGIGKSTVAAEFCDCAKRSQRFSCIQWIHGKHSPGDQLKEFMGAMRGRKEKDVLLVLDDVEDPDALAELLPKHTHFYTIMTTTKPVSTCTKYHVSEPQALPPSVAQGFVDPLKGGADESTKALFTFLGFVPLLLSTAIKLLEHEVCSSAEMLERLEKSPARQQEGTLSVREAMRVLLDIATNHLETSFPTARSSLVAVACLHLGEISSALLDSIVGGDSSEFSLRCVELGILTHKWDSDSFSLHTVVAQVLRDAATSLSTELDKVATIVLSLWPRRWRGMNSELATSLVWHTSAMLDICEGRKLTLSNDMMACLDRAATYCSMIEGRELRTAVRCWTAMLSQWKTENKIGGEDFARVAAELGRVLHFLRDDRAKDVLKTAYDASKALYGERHSTTAQVMCCYCLYLEDGDLSAAEEVHQAADAIRARLQTVDEVLSKEETRMLQESLCVLLIRRMQMLMSCSMDSEAEEIWKEVTAIRHALTAASTKKKP